ncbi:MAG: AsmA family protein [Proteobacteria bacterium]|nr:AsmA family protein [Pseudomonadota bacterium]
MRAARITGIVVAALVLLAIVGLLALKLFVDPNQFKPRIVAAVRESTGRELTLPGDLRLGVFPWVSVEFGPATLGNPAGFPQAPFVAVRHVALRVRLLPLLAKKLEIGRIDIDGLDVRLQRNAQGKGNWEGLGGKDDKSATASAPGSGTASAEALRDLGGVAVHDSRFSFRDLTAEKINLEVGRVSSGIATPVSARLLLTTKAGAAPLDLTARFIVTPDLAASRIALAQLEFEGSRAADHGSPALGFKFSAPQLLADLKAQTASAPQFAAELAQARLSGSLAGTHIVDAPAFEGSFKLEPVSPRDLLGTLGTALPATRDPKALSRLSAAGSFSYGGNAAEAHGLEVRLDDSTLRGKVAVTDLKTDAMSFELALDQIDFDRYRAPPPAAGQKAPPQTAAKPGTAGTAEPQGLRTLVLDGTLTVGTATVAKLHATQFSATLAARDAVLRLAPLRAQIYGGSYSGEVTLDSRGAVPVLKLDQTLTNVDVAPLLRDLANSSRLSGRGNVSTNVSARGLTADEILASLNGHAAADLANGAIEGMDLWFEINRATTVIQKQSLPTGASSGRTKFDELKMSADITNGVASSKDLSIASQNFRVGGAGTVNLASEAVDYRLNATVLRQPAPGPVTAANTLVSIPVQVSGTLASPKVRPDLEGLARARVQQELDKHKGELQQKVQDQLKNIFK